MSRCVVAWPYLDLTVWHSRIYVRRTLIRTGSDETASRRLTARGARGGGRGGLPAVRVRPPPRLRATAVQRTQLPAPRRPSGRSRPPASAHSCSGSPALPAPGSRLPVKGPARQSARRLATRTRSHGIDGRDPQLGGRRAHRRYPSGGLSPRPTLRPTRCSLTTIYTLIPGKTVRARSCDGAHQDVSRQDLQVAKQLLALIARPHMAVLGTASTAAHVPASVERTTTASAAPNNRTNGIRRIAAPTRIASRPSGARLFASV